MAPKATLTNMIRLTIVSDVDGSPRIKNGEHAGVIEACSVCGEVLDLEVETEGWARVLQPERLFTLAPWNEGREPAGLVMKKVFSGKVFKTPRGSLRSLRVPSPVLVIVVVTFRFSNPLTLASGVEILRIRLGAAETEATRATRERHRE